ncbi:MAG: T9SS type A sorting domain-containing protein [Bacteroidota bacterium]
MMRLLPTLFLFVLTASLSAQITVTSASFPSVGDTLKVALDGMPSGIDVGPSGTDQTWDFTSLQGITRENVVRPASGGNNADRFPTADIVTDLDPIGELYIRKTNSRYEQVGYAGIDPVGLGLNVVVNFEPSIVDRRAPMTYPEVNTSGYEITLPFSVDEIPGDILDNLPVTPDSVRLRVVSSRTDFVDAWGEMEVPGGTYQVLREQRTELRESTIETKINPLPWIDVTDLVMGAFPFLGTDTILTYNFYTEGIKEPVAIVTVDAEEETVQSVEYVANDVINNVAYVNSGRADVFAYPNPAIESARFEFMNLDRGAYRLVIYNILGVEVWRNDYEINQDQRTTKVDLSDFRKGTYLYSLIDERGKTLTTKRLIILRP